MKTLYATILVALVAITVLTVAPLTYAAVPAAEALTADETAALLYMREEEKLAHDVYVVLGEKWSLPAFDNISGAEAQHTSAVKNLLDGYGLADPTADLPAGKFADSTLQGLYDSLTARGLQSLNEALRVGAEIEELDILDLQAYMDKTERSDVDWVFGNLLRGSENHLRAFSSLIERETGDAYKPLHLSQTAYDAIANGAQGRGNQGGRGQGHGRGRGR